MTPCSSIEVTLAILSQYPLSKYQPLGYYSDLNSQDMGDPDKLSVYSGSTEAYWPLDQEVQQPTKCTTAMQILRLAHLKSARFNILVHGIHRCKLCYYFKCKEPNCVYSFCTLKGWNLHHWMAHKTLLKCKDCSQKFLTPSAHRAHRNMHAPPLFTCESCGKSFPFKSAL